MKCQICGKEKEFNSTFCTSCGNKLLNENNYINPTRNSFKNSEFYFSNNL